MGANHATWGSSGRLQGLGSHADSHKSRSCGVRSQAALRPPPSPDQGRGPGARPGREKAAVHFPQRTPLFARLEVPPSRPIGDLRAPPSGTVPICATSRSEQRQDLRATHQAQPRILELRSDFKRRLEPTPAPAPVCPRVRDAGLYREEAGSQVLPQQVARRVHGTRSRWSGILHRVARFLLHNLRNVGTCGRNRTALDTPAASSSLGAHGSEALGLT